MNWSVDFEGRFRAWVAGDRPSDALIDAVSFWLTVAEGVWTAGITPEHVANDLYRATSTGTPLRVNFLAIMQDRVIVVKEIR